MNHLRDLLEFAAAGGGPALHFSREELASMWAQTKISGEQAMCFSIGTVNSLLDLKVIPELLRLPYQTCWFEAEAMLPDNRLALLGVLAVERSDHSISAVVFVRRNDRSWLFRGWVTVLRMGAEEVKLDGSDHTECQVLALAIKCVAAFLSALHCCNVRRQETRPCDKLQRARAKRGKLPLFSYWTLQLTDRAEPRATLGGTHAGPRVHLRRGHPREYSADKFTWVQPHTVGNKAKGMVHKDYRTT